MTSTAPRRVVVVGGGYIGAPLARALDADHDVTLIDRLPVFFHRMAALRAAVDPAAIDLPFLSRDSLLERGRIVAGEVVGIRPDEHVLDLADGSVVPYDVAVIATGQTNQAVAQFAGSDLSSAADHFRHLQQQIALAPAVAVIGGGITGVELVGEISAAHPGKPVALLSHGRIVPTLPDKAARKLTGQLTGRGVRVVAGATITEENLAGAVHDAGLPDDALVLWATGDRPELGWLQAAHPDWGSDEGIVVDEYLRVGGRDDLFAVGDIAATPGPKGAMNGRVQIPVIEANIAAGGPAKKYKPSGPRIALVPLGPHGGIVSVGLGGVELVLGGPIVARIKGRTLLTPIIDKSLGNR